MRTRPFRDARASAIRPIVGAQWARLAIAVAVAAALLPAALANDDAAAAEDTCLREGWQQEFFDVNGIERNVFWKAPAGGTWTRGAIVALHGGGGSSVNYCSSFPVLTQPMVRFARLALQSGFAVFSLDSTNQVTDNAGELCGKVWDDEVRDRPNLDLPYIEDVLTRFIPERRPAGSATELFMTGLSSGGFMTTRAATHFDDLVTAFAPVATGDPYGWYRNCAPDNGLPRGTGENTVYGKGYDSETDLEITKDGACVAPAYPNEKTWETAGPAQRPPFKRFHHVFDGIVDLSCHDKAVAQSEAHGYPNAGSFLLTGPIATKSLLFHYWQEDYNQPMVDFFTAQLSGD